MINITPTVFPSHGPFLLQYLPGVNMRAQFNYSIPRRCEVEPMTTKKAGKLTCYRATQLPVYITFDASSPCAHIIDATCMAFNRSRLVLCNQGNTEWQGKSDWPNTQGTQHNTEVAEGVYNKKLSLNTSSSWTTNWCDTHQRDTLMSVTDLQDTWYQPICFYLDGHFYIEASLTSILMSVGHKTYAALI